MDGRPARDAHAVAVEGGTTEARGAMRNETRTRTWSLLSLQLSR